MQLTFVLALMFVSPQQVEGQRTTRDMTSIRLEDGSRTITIKDSQRDYKIEYDGEIVISDDDKDIESISRGGYLEIKKSRFGKKRRLIIEADGGKLIRKYFVGWKEVPFNPEGKKWLAEILPDLVRRTTLGAQSRVDRFYKKGGAKAVMAEVREMESDYVQTAYVKLLLKKNLSKKELVSVINVVGKYIKSDYYASQILKTNQKAFLASTETTDAYIKAASSLSSDYYMSQVLKTVITNKEISDSQLTSLLRMSDNISSDYYLSQVLVSILDKRALNAQNINTVIESSKTISSDHYKSQVLRKALKKNNLSTDNYEKLLASMVNVQSDHYASQIIGDLLTEEMDRKNLPSLLRLLKQNIQSDVYSTRIFKKMAAQKNFTDAELVQIVETIGSTVRSYHYLSSALVSYAPQVKKGSAKLKEAYATAAKKIKSDTYFGRAMKAIY